MNSIGQLSLDSETASSMMPELIMLLGLIAIVVVPNLGDAKFRLPLTSVRVPVLLGGSRFDLTNDPRMPNRISNLTFSLALLSSLLLISESPSEVGGILVVDSFSRLFSTMFLAALLLVSIATTHRLPAKTNAHIPKESDSENVFDRKISILIDNRRQVDFYILLIMVGLGMTMMTMATNLFMLIVCIELASLSTYVLVAFHKEDGTGGEAGAKYFIVGSVASAIGIYGMSLLYLWSGSLDLEILRQSWLSMEGIDPFAAFGIGMMLVAFGFKVSAAPFHLAAPDAYSGAASQVSGLLATASKAMGFLALFRVLVMITVPDGSEAIWMIALGIFAIVTMTWGNLAALTSENPKRMLAYSSVAHAGYMLAAIAVVGSGISSVDQNAIILTAVSFHLFVLVLFKLGAFLVLALLETEGKGHEIEHLYGLGRRDPLIAGSMFLFVLSLAGVPPLSGFLSKLLMINGIVSTSASTGSSSSVDIVSWAESVDPLFWLAAAIVLNSALSLFYYLRIGLVMFFEEPSTEKSLKAAPSLRMAIFACALLTVLCGIGPVSEWLLDTVSSAIDSLMYE
ncbi:MAG TPA: NADH-quinone oxidoreductase subunit N [Candidatus Poseidoniales archaeon]|nr:MAG TPA: NADH-quinone oxidoreductase subunit N [Candidatus Poseidoniales archaeon]HII26647.1 NADH-quinone oxidoreductase subunit N [Candidatus Thalassarchaeaceae archaeon]